MFVLSLARAGLGPCVRFEVLTLSPWHPDSGPSFHPRGILILSLHILILNPQTPRGWTCHFFLEDFFGIIFIRIFVEVPRGMHVKPVQIKPSEIFWGHGQISGEQEFYLVTDPVTRGDVTVTKGNIHHITPSITLCHVTYCRCVTRWVWWGDTGSDKVSCIDCVCCNQPRHPVWQHVIKYVMKCVR